MIAVATGATENPRNYEAEKMALPSQSALGPTAFFGGAKSNQVSVSCAWSWSMLPFFALVLEQGRGGWSGRKVWGLGGISYIYTYIYIYIYNTYVCMYVYKYISY